MKQSELLEELIQVNAEAMEKANEFSLLTIEQLNHKEDDDKWSILECLEHLNLYGRFYLPEIERHIAKAREVGIDNEYKSSFIGDFFVQSIKSNNKKKMKAMQSMTPNRSDLSLQTVEVFKGQLQRLKDIMEMAKTKDLKATKTAISLTKWVKLRLGDTLRFVVYHNERHVFQARAVLTALRERN